MSRPSGFVFRLEKTRGASWWAKYRLPDGTQVKRKIGPVWTGRGRPAEGHFTKRLAEDWLHDRLEELRRSDAAASPAAALVPAAVGVTFAEAALEYLRFAEQDRGCKPSTVRGYMNAIRVHLLPVFGEMKLEDITVREIERWRAGMSSVRVQRELSNKTKNNLLVLMHAIFRHAVKLYGLRANPVAQVDRFRVRSSGDIQVFSPEEVWALVRAAKSEADAAIFLTAAFTGLRRGELLGLRWRDVDFAGSTIRVRASYAAGKLTTPKSGKVRAVPMAPDVAGALAKLGDRGRFAGDDDFVFAGEVGAPLDGDALSSRYRDARAGVDGPRRHSDDDEVPALRAEEGRRRPCCAGVRNDQAEPRRQPRLKTATVTHRSEPRRLSVLGKANGRAPSALPPAPKASSPAVRSVMQGNRSTQTRPEVALRSELHRRGLRFRKHRQVTPALRCRADVVFSKARVAVFVDGCFWHRCPEHLTDPRTNSSYWAAKLDRNVARDRRNDAALEAAGWLVVRVWEHESPPDAADRVEAALRKTR